MPNADTPTLSIIVIGYRMSRQLENTLYTLSIHYQRNVKQADYEVIVVENESDDEIDESIINALGANFHFYKRKETSTSPVSAVNFAFERCHGEFICLIIDGARMVTPRTIEYALMAYKISKNAIAMVPGYHLGSREQHLHGEDYSFSRDQELLDSIDWQNNGYLLFTISTFSNGNRRGYLQPMMECSCVFASRGNFARIEYADKRFSLPGGGGINLHIYRSLGMLPGSKLFVLPGEGSFHQFHGGVTTSSDPSRAQTMERYNRQLNELWPGGFQALRREPILLGAVTQWANDLLQRSSQLAQRRFGRLVEQQKPSWPDDEMLNEKQD